MDMSNTDITSQIIQIIQPFFIDDTNIPDLESQELGENTSDQILHKDNNIYTFDLVSEQHQPTASTGSNVSPPPQTDSFGLFAGDGKKNVISGISPSLLNSFFTNTSIPHSVIAQLINSAGIEIPFTTSEPITENTIYCDQCPFHTNDQICMMDHTMIYHDGMFNEYACDRCSAYFQSMHELDDHIESMHPKKTFKKMEKKVNSRSITPSVQPENDEDVDYGEPIVRRIENIEEYPVNVTEKNASQYVDITHTEKNKINEHEKLSEKKSQFTRLSRSTIISKIENINKNNVDKNLENEYSEDEYEEEPHILSSEEIAKQKLHKWSSIRGKFQCQICQLKFTSQEYLGEHFMVNHHSYEDQLELDLKLKTTSFPGFEVLEEIKYLSFPELHEFKEKSCEICCEDYLISHNSNIKTVNSLYVDYYEGDILYPIVMKCCENNHACHKCVKGYLNENYLNGMLYCPFCQQDRTQYGLSYLQVTEIMCNKKIWEKWWSRGDKLDILTGYTKCLPCNGSLSNMPVNPDVVQIDHDNVQIDHDDVIIDHDFDY